MLVGCSCSSAAGGVSEVFKAACKSGSNASQSSMRFCNDDCRRSACAVLRSTAPMRSCADKFGFKSQGTFLSLLRGQFHDLQFRLQRPYDCVEAWDLDVRTTCVRHRLRRLRRCAFRHCLRLQGSCLQIGFEPGTCELLFASRLRRFQERGIAHHLRSFSCSFRCRLLSLRIREPRGQITRDRTGMGQRIVRSTCQCRHILHCFSLDFVDFRRKPV